MKAKYLIKGIIKTIPGIEFIYKFSRTTGGTNDARYCYSVWLRHLIYGYENGRTSVPGKIAELGPGDSLGVGIAALISGAEQYFAFDVKKYNNSARNNLEIFDELVLLFKNRTPLPDHNEFPRLKPYLKNYTFPDHIFTKNYMQIILNDERLNKIRNSINVLDDSETNEAENMITYKVPWNDSFLVDNESIDMIISQGVLQYINDLQPAFETMFKWLKPKGLMSHQITFRSLDSSDTWFGNWEYSDLEWKIINGRNPVCLNREPYSTYIKMLTSHNFKILFEKKVIEETIIDKRKLARRFKNLTTEDTSISGLFIQATK